MDYISKLYKRFITSVNALIQDPQFSDLSDFLKDFKGLMTPQFVFTHFMTRSNKSAAEELEIHYCDQLGNNTAPTLPYLLQIIKKYLPQHFESVFQHFTNSLDAPNLFNDSLRLLGYDGSKVNLPPNLIFQENHPFNKKDYYYPAKKNKNGKGYNQLHLNGVYDLLNHIFVAFSTQPGRKTDERSAMFEQVSRMHAENPESDAPLSKENPKRCHIADRGYESYALIASLIMMNELFLIRGRDIKSNGIARSLCEQSTDEFDIDWEKIITKRHTKETQELHPELYKILNPNQWKYLLKDLLEYHLKLRIVRIKLSEGHYEILLTNLDREHFPPEVLRELYNLRWQQESAYRKLKYQIGLAFLHHVNMDTLGMEITARMIFFNFCGSLFQHLNLKCPPDKQIDFAYLVNQVRRYIQQGAGRGIYFYKKIEKHTVPIRKNRNFKRNIRAQSFKSFTNRG